MQWRLAADMIERAAQHLAADGDNALDSFGEPCHEPLEDGAKRFGGEQAEQPTEGVVAGNTVLEPQEATQERLLRRCGRRHVRGTLTATQNRA